MTKEATLDSEAISAENSLYTPERIEVKNAVSASIMDGLPLIARSLGIIYLVLTAAHVMLLPADQRVILAPLAALSAALYFAAYFILRKQTVDSRYANTIVGTFGLIGLVNSLVHLAISGDPLQSTNVMLITLATGALYLSASWFWFTVVIAVAGWVAVVMLNPGLPTWVHFGIGLALSVAIGAVINRIRVRNSRQVQILRLQQAKQQENILASRDQLEHRVEERTAELNEMNNTLVREAAERKKVQDELKRSREELLIERQRLKVLVEQQTAELRNLNSTLVEVSQKKDEVLMDVSSDFRPILHEILSNTEILNEQLFGELNQRQTSLVSTIHNSGDRLLAMLDDVKNVSRLDGRLVNSNSEPAPQAVN